MMLGGMFFFWLFGVLFMVAIFWVLWRLLSGGFDRTSASKREDAALQQLRMRLARGEIDEAEFQRLKKLLRNEEEAK